MSKIKDNDMEWTKIEPATFTKWLEAVKKVKNKTNIQFSNLMNICLYNDDEIDFSKPLLDEIKRLNIKVNPSIKKLL
jgi:hypothetical protein